MVQSGKGRILLRSVLPTLPRPLMVGVFSVPGQRRTNLWRQRTNLRTGSERLRGVIRRLDPEGLAFFGLEHRWWRHPRPRMLRSSPEQSLALHRCLLEEDTGEETVVIGSSAHARVGVVPDALVGRRGV